MEVCVPCNSRQDLRTNVGSSANPHKPNYCNSKGLSGNDLKTHLTGFLNIEISSRGFNLSPGKNATGNVASEDECKDLDRKNSSNSASEKCFSKCATFLPLGDPKSSVDGVLNAKKKQENDAIAGDVSEGNGYSKSVKQCYTRSISLRNTSKLISAMKGNREKQGLQPKNLSVTWAPDVYDPTPTSVSHVPSNKNQCYGKKYGKHKQKGGGKSRASKGKDKKQTRKKSTGTSKIKPSVVVGFSEHDVGIGDSSDPWEFRAIL